MKSITYTARADAALRKMPVVDAEKIEAKIEQYAINPESLANNVKQLKGDTAWRLRVGSYRVLFDDDGVILDILDIGKRSRVYR